MAKHDPEFEIIVHDTVDPRRPWLNNTWEWAWYNALEELDKKGKKDLLLSLLRSSSSLSLGVRLDIADLLERHDLKKKRGRPRVPSYEMSDAERNALNLRDRVRELVNNGGMKSRDAIAKVAKENKMSEDSVANAYGGRRGSTRRLMQRMLKHHFGCLSIVSVPSDIPVYSFTINDSRTRDGTS
jgi:hypothetical protein